MIIHPVPCLFAQNLSPMLFIPKDEWAEGRTVNIQFLIIVSREKTNDCKVAVLISVQLCHNASIIKHIMIRMHLNNTF